MIDFEILNQNLKTKTYDHFATTYSIATPVIGCDERYTENVTILCAVYHANFEGCKLSHHNALWANNVSNVKHLYTIINNSDVETLQEKLKKLPVILFLHWLTAKKLAKQLNIKVPIVIDGHLWTVCSQSKLDAYLSIRQQKPDEVLFTFNNNEQITYGDYQAFLTSMATESIYQVVQSEKKFLATGLADSFCGKLSTMAFVLPEQIAYKSQNLEFFSAWKKFQTTYHVSKITIIDDSDAVFNSKQRKVTWNNLPIDCKLRQRDSLECTIEENRITLKTNDQVLKTFGFDYPAGEINNFFYFFYKLYKIPGYEKQKRIVLTVDKTQYDAFKAFFQQTEDVNLYQVCQTLKEVYHIKQLSPFFKWFYQKKLYFYLKLEPEKYVHKIKIMTQ